MAESKVDHLGAYHFNQKSGRVGLIEILRSAECLSELVVHAHQRSATFVDELESSIHRGNLAEVLIGVFEGSAVVMQKVRHFKCMFRCEVVHPVVFVLFEPSDGHLERGHCGYIAL